MDGHLEGLDLAGQYNEPFYFWVGFFFSITEKGRKSSESEAYFQVIRNSLRLRNFYLLILEGDYTVSFSFDGLMTREACISRSAWSLGFAMS